MMYRFSKFFLIIFASLLFLQCKRDLEEEMLIAENKKIESFLSSYDFEYKYGVYHAVVTPGYSYPVTTGDTVAFWFKGYTLDNKVFETNIKSEAIAAGLDTTIRSFDSIVFVAGSGELIDGLNRGLLLCREYEQSKIVFSSVYGFGNQNIGPIGQWSPLGYDVDIIYVTNSSIRNERAIIKELVDNAGYRFSEHNTGLWYSIASFSASGSNPVEGDTVYAWYTGITPDGNIFTETQYPNQQVVIGDNEMPLGLSVGFTLLKPGERANIIVPSPIGYGVDGNSDYGVEQYTPLQYEIRLDSLKTK